MQKILLQLFKEFIGPLVGALVWVVVNFDGNFMKSATLFGGTFFFLSWLTSQIFRVKKQTATEGALLDIRSDIDKLLTDLKSRTDDLVGLITGGKSFCRLELAIDTDGYCEHGMVFHEGTFALHDVEITVCDLDKLDELKLRGVSVSDLVHNKLPKIPTMAPTTALPIYLGLDIGIKGTFRLNFIIRAKNGVFIQEERGILQNGVWSSASRVRREKELTPCFEFVDKLYPLDQKEKVDWR